MFLSFWTLLPLLFQVSLSYESTVVVIRLTKETVMNLNHSCDYNLLPLEWNKHYMSHFRFLFWFVTSVRTSPYLRYYYPYVGRLQGLRTLLRVVVVTTEAPEPQYFFLSKGSGKYQAQMMIPAFPQGPPTCPLDEWALLYIHVPQKKFILKFLFRALTILFLTCIVL